jgi:ADP-heptose:LPS heptosyltransferase
MRILIVRPDKLGDLIATLPMATAIKRAMPDAHVTFMVRDYTAPLLEIAPDVDDVVIYYPSQKPREKINLFKSIRTDTIFFPVSKFDLAFYAKLAYKPKRVGSVGTGYRFYSMLYTHRVYEHRKKAKRHEAEYNVRMLSEIGIEPAETPLARLELRAEDLLRTDENIVTLFGKQSQKYCVLHVGSGGSSFDWPIERYAEFAKWVAQRLSLPIVLTGLRSERETLLSVSQVMERQGASVKLFVDKPLLELAGLLSRAELVLASSTGPGHLAAALGTPTLGLFPLIRPLSKARWGFRGEAVSNIEPEMPPKPTCPDCKRCECMQAIDTKQVSSAAEKLLKI